LAEGGQLGSPVHREHQVGRHLAPSLEQEVRQVVAELAAALACAGAKIQTPSRTTTTTAMTANSNGRQITTVLILGFAVAFLGWAIVYLASAPVHPHEDDAIWTPFRRWLAGATHRLLKARK